MTDPIEVERTQLEDLRAFLEAARVRITELSELRDTQSAALDAMGRAYATLMIERDTLEMERDEMLSQRDLWEAQNEAAGL